MTQLASELKSQEHVQPADEVSFSIVDDNASLNLVWPEILPMVERGLRHGQGDGTTADGFLAGIVRGEMRLWVAHIRDEVLAGIILEVKQHRTCRKVWIHMAAGRDMDKWYPTLAELLVDYRDLVGAKCIEASCRSGLAKYLAEHGWSRKAIIMELT